MPYDLPPDQAPSAAPSPEKARISCVKRRRLQTVPSIVTEPFPGLLFIFSFPLLSLSGQSRNSTASPRNGHSSKSHFSPQKNARQTSAAVYLPEPKNPASSAPGPASSSNSPCPRRPTARPLPYTVQIQIHIKKRPYNPGGKQSAPPFFLLFTRQRIPPETAVLFIQPRTGRYTKICRTRGTASTAAMVTKKQCTSPGDRASVLCMSVRPSGIGTHGQNILHGRIVVQIHNKNQKHRQKQPDADHKQPRQSPHRFLLSPPCIPANLIRGKTPSTFPVI